MKETIKVSEYTDAILLMQDIILTLPMNEKEEAREIVTKLRNQRMERIKHIITQPNPPLPQTL